MVKEIIAGIAESREHVEISDNTNIIYVVDDNCINFNEFDGIFEKICKTLAFRLSKVSFNGIAHYSNFSTNYDVYNIITYRYRKNELIKKIFLENILMDVVQNAVKDISRPQKSL